MAGVLRTFARQGRIFPPLNQLQSSKLTCICVRNISTSKNKKDTIDGAIQPMPKSSDLKKLEEHFADADPAKDKNWISYGFDYEDKEMDRFHWNLYMGIVTFCIVWFGFVLSYQPDHRLKDWTVREAYLEIEHREKNGLPLVDPNLIPADKMVLPPEEELQDVEIII